MKTPVIVIGLGPMGAAMARTFLENGHPTTVWNRTPSKAAPLVKDGATLAPTAAEALAASELVVVSQTDYKAMYDSLDGADLKGRVIVNLSSGSPGELRRAGEWVSERGGALLTGGVMVPPPGIGQPGAYVFYSGPEGALEPHREALGELGDVTFVGEDPGLSMLYYQSQIYVFWSTLTAYMHAVALLGTAGVSAQEFRPFAASLLTELAGDGPMGFLNQLTEEMEAGVYPGADNTLRMQAVGADHVVEAAREAGIDAAGPTALRELFWRAVDAGHGTDGLSAVIEAVRRP
ncbi:3-hydroxyisobutyrate dehydrogenase-like beta-hydroxyacid dehydrogenase [Actinomadura coerulea]|uniref:3-hydroxyisobutyrate dehydrogenase-like beta-hydroxyacid dehydrogenase n=1 Tax=Actinomadura coerulea TaxID=46159 RepID=A0A7X0G3Y1_9ACTN|nr:NAD(P)-binding domain-containing protein [Actinomadura coerulea]MBB6398287.1 3-hydroxyisobutyrate dehydrogenase-like beta-hydroxyacid dehydrogenase [Actinomadura coerulea]GGQ10752.1 dehydrogenase [Actinomadura coerulea]